MIAVDTNILVYSVRADSPWHDLALDSIRSLAEGRVLWAIAWPCIHEFLAIVTSPKIYKPPTPLSDAMLQVDYWMESPVLRLLGEEPGYWEHLKALLSTAKAAGAVVHDARVAAICRSCGVQEIWTADRDFLRFGSLPARNPLTTQ